MEVKMNYHKSSHRAALLLMLVGLFALLLAPGARRASAADAQWRARYYNNRTLSGNPLWDHFEDAIDHDWGGGSPNAALMISDDNFSVKWTRTINLSAGNYRFSATMDDGMRVWIDDQLVIDSWTDSQVHTVTADRSLSAGDHSFRVEYYEAGGVAVAKFSWQQIASSPPGVFNFWKGEYFNNQTLAGAPTVTRDDAAVNFDWSVGSPAPGIAADHFSVRWTRTLNFAAGTYTFETFSDDGVRLWINSLLVIDQWRDQSDGHFFASVALSGPTTIRLEFYENVGRAAVSLSWTPPGGSSIPGTTPPGGPTATVTGTGGARLNIRSAPGGPIVGQLQPNQTVGLTGFRSSDSAWVEIFRPGGGIGWVSAQFVTTSVPVSSLAVK
jgi:hypothetical protein